MSADLKLRAKVKRIAQLEMFYRLSPFWRLPLAYLLFLFFNESQSTGDTGPITEWFFTREVVRSWAVFAPFAWAGPFLLVPFFHTIRLTYQLELATDPAAPVCAFCRLWRVTRWLCINMILLVLELLSELGCIWALSEGVFGLKPVLPVFMRVEVIVSMIYLVHRFLSLGLVARFVKELEQEHKSSRFQLTQIQEQNSNPIPPKQTSITIAIPD